MDFEASHHLDTSSAGATGSSSYRAPLLSSSFTQYSSLRDKTNLPDASERFNAPLLLGSSSLEGARPLTTPTTSTSHALANYESRASHKYNTTLADSLLDNIGSSGGGANKYHNHLSDIGGTTTRGTYSLAGASFNTDFAPDACDVTGAGAGALSMRARQVTSSSLSEALKSDLYPHLSASLLRRPLGSSAITRDPPPPLFSSSTTNIDKLLYAGSSSTATAQATTTAPTTTTAATTTTSRDQQLFVESRVPPPALYSSSSLSRDKEFNSSTLVAGERTTESLTNLTASHQATSGRQLIRQLFDDMRQIQDTVDSIEIPARGRCKVFMAKYGYDPFKQSPNENPDAELAFNAGDYIMVFDDIDEDGYFIGELMDGRRGYVPSNWLDRLTGDDLFDFQANVLYKQAGTNNINNTSNGGNNISKTTANNNNSNNNAINQLLALDDELVDAGAYPPEFYDALVADTLNHSNFQHLLAPEDYHRMNDYIDLDDVNEVDDECLSDYERAEAEQLRRAVPPPQRLVLERQLNKCILIAWLHPQSTKGSIVSYQVYVDGVLKSTVPSGDRTKALLEGVDSNIPHRISVRAIDLSGRHSNDAGCTIVIGHGVPFAPSCVKASHITSDSALISWLPCNSNFHHVVAVNSVEVQTVRPGAYKHLINGLSANTLYRVWVRAKPGKLLAIDEKNPKKLESLTTYVDFKTMPKSLPDPPVNVQVEAGPQRRTLLVTWLPLTLNDFGSSNGCAVTGYAVFAGHKKLADIDSPTGDHALLDISDLESLHKKSVTVRTKSGENLSQDSMPCQIPDEYLKATNQRDILSIVSSSNAGPNSAMISHHHHHQQQQHRARQQQQHASTSTNASGRDQSPQSRRRQMARAMPQHRGVSATLVGGRYSQPATTSTTTNSAGRNLIGGGGRAAFGAARSLQNLESDLDSRRSSIPAIEITRETSGSELMASQQTESYSEEEFESSMRFRGAMHQQRSNRGSGRGGRHLRSSARSVDGRGLASSMRHRPVAPPNSLRSVSGGGGGEQVRFFAALFDYDPLTMSPNPNAATEELAFKEGSVIKVYGGLGDDGFYKGELIDSQQAGFVPCNVITEITDPQLLAGLYANEKILLANLQMQPPPVAHRQAAVAPPLMGNPTNNSTNQMLDATSLQNQQQQQQQFPGSTASGGGGGAVKRMVALYDYDPQENSPNADTESEIPFKTGDIIYVYGKMDTDGFYMGEVERTKQRGLVPSNFLREEPLSMSSTTNKQQHQMGINSMQNQQALMMQSNQQQHANNLIGQQQPHQMQMHQQQAMDNIQQQQQQQQQQQSINRPNSLSLNNPLNQTTLNPNATSTLAASGGGGGLMHMQNNINQAMVQQQQPLGIQNNQMNLMNSNQATLNQLQMQENQQMIGRTNISNMNANAAILQNQQQRTVNQQQMLNQQQLMNNNQHQQQQHQQQQQQQQQGGVLSNLLSSGKQIIGAATTPRNPNQPFPVGMQHQMNASGQQMMTNASVGTVGLDNRFSGQNIMQQQQQQASNAFNNQHTSSAMNNQFGHANNNNTTTQFGSGIPNQTTGTMGIGMQQQQHYNQMGPNNFNRGANLMNQMGEEQGGNILNTVKNMFKL